MVNLFNIYKNIFLIRTVEDMISQEYHKGQMRCPVHLSIGQEACASAFILHLDKKDKLYSNHRCHAHYLAKGGSLKKMISEIYGKKTGCISGIGGSMHLQDIDVGLEASIPIVSSAIALATGSALNQKKNKSKNITVVYVGDAALEEGVFYECANFASIHKLPLIFVCENNLFSCFTNIKQRQINDDFSRYAKAFNIPYLRLDGNKADLISPNAKKIISRVKKGNGPFFLQLDTYRYLEHCGPASDDKLNYRNKKEVKNWKNKCPVSYLRKIICKKINKTKVFKAEKEIIDEVKKAFKFAENSSLPENKNAKRYVYA